MLLPSRWLAFGCSRLWSGAGGEARRGAAIFEEGSEGFSGFKNFNSGKGLGVTLLISSEERISTWDNEAASLKIGGAADCRWGRSWISQDRKSLSFEIFTAGNYELDTNGAVKVTGEIPMTLASGSGKELKSAAFKAALGEKISFPESGAETPQMAVRSVRQFQPDDESIEVVVTTNRKIEEFAGFRFLNAEGRRSSFSKPAAHGRLPVREAAVTSCSFSRPHRAIWCWLFRPTRRGNRSA